MKKLVLCLALATVAVSCKKIQAGGNKSVIKLEEGTERYSDDHQTSDHAGHVADTHGAEGHHGNETVAPKTDSASIEKNTEAKTATEQE